MRKNPDELLLIDVREEEEWSKGHIEGAEFFALSWLESGKNPKNNFEGKLVVLYCQSGIRSKRFAQILKSQRAHIEPRSLDGGYIQWTPL